MPVLVGDEIVEHDHLVDRVGHIRDAQGFTAVEVVPVDGRAVVLGKALHHPPGADKLCVRRDEILADAVWQAVVPEQGIRDVGDAQPFRHQRGDDFVEGLL